MLKRSAVRAAIYARGTIGEAAGAVAVACGAVPTAVALTQSRTDRGSPRVTTTITGSRRGG